MVKINLLPLKVKKTNIALKLYTYILIGGSVLFLLLVFLLINLVAQTNSAKRKIKTLENKRQEIADQVSPIRAIMAQDQEKQDIEKLIYNLASQQSTWVTLLDSLADQISEDLWLNHLVVSTVPKTSGWQVTLSGEAYHKISVADFLANLEKAPRFFNVKLEALSDPVEKQTASVQFKVSLNCSDVLPSVKGGRP